MKGRKSSNERLKNLDEFQTLAEKISSKIRALREAAGYTSHETFAYEKGFDRTQWGKIERGVDMKISTLERALKALNISPTEFFKDFK